MDTSTSANLAIKAWFDTGAPNSEARLSNAIDRMANAFETNNGRAAAILAVFCGIDGVTSETVDLDGLVAALLQSDEEEVLGPLTTAQAEALSSWGDAQEELRYQADRMKSSMERTLTQLSEGVIAHYLDIDAIQVVKAEAVYGATRLATLAALRGRDDIQELFNGATGPDRFTFIRSMTVSA